MKLETTVFIMFEMFIYWQLDFSISLETKFVKQQ